MDERHKYARTLCLIVFKYLEKEPIIQAQVWGHDWLIWSEIWLQNWLANFLIFYFFVWAINWLWNCCIAWQWIELIQKCNSQCRLCDKWVWYFQKSMAEIEVKATENVIKACARAPSVRNCVLTSSLLACTWRDGSAQDLSSVVNYDSWSDESLCINKKVYFFPFLLPCFQVSKHKLWEEEKLRMSWGSGLLESAFK